MAKFANSEDPDEMPQMRHFIWVFTVVKVKTIFGDINTL